MKTHSFETDEAIRIATENSSFKFMKKHESQFNENLLRRHRNVAASLPMDTGTTSFKVCHGKSGSGAILSDDLKSKIQLKWTEVVVPFTKCATYEDLRKQIKSWEVS
jgi:hypothetical protein